MMMFNRKLVRGIDVVVLEILFIIISEGISIDDRLKDLDHFIKHTVKCRNIPSASVSLVKDGEVIFSRGYGYFDVAKETKATEHTKFCIGSLTKAFTSTILADILSKDDKLSWDTRICDILGPDFEFIDKIRTEHTTIRDILSHRIGLPSNFHPLLVGFPANTSRAHLVKKLKYMPAASEFRTKFHYSNYLYMLAGHVAEVITGESWETMVAERLFKPLAMHSSGFVDSDDALGNIAVPYVSKNRKLVAIDKELLLTVSPLGPAGSIYSTASDMAKWMMFHLRRGRNWHGGKVVDITWLQETYQSQMTHPFKDKDLTRPTYPVTDVTISYNMGWMSSVYRGFRKFWHSGGIVTFISQLWLFPELNAGVFVSASGPLSSQGSAAVKNIAARASDILLGLEPWLNLSTTCTSPAPWKTPTPKELATQEVSYFWNINRTFTDFIGVYGHMGFGTISIYVDKDQYLLLKFGRFGIMQLNPITNEMFVGRYVDKLWFFTNSDGNVDGIPITFVRNEDKEVTGLLFPIEFSGNKTLFLKGSLYDSRTKSSYKPYSQNTSSTCAGSGPAVNVGVSEWNLIMLSVCLLAISIR